MYYFPPRCVIYENNQWTPKVYTDIVHIYAIETLNTNSKNAHLLEVCGFVICLKGGLKTTQRREMVWIVIAAMRVMLAEHRRYAVNIYWQQRWWEFNYCWTYPLHFFLRNMVHWETSLWMSQRLWHFELCSYCVIGSDHTCRREIN